MRGNGQTGAFALSFRRRWVEEQDNRRAAAEKGVLTGGVRDHGKAKHFAIEVDRTLDVADIKRRLKQVFECRRLLSPFRQVSHPARRNAGALHLSRRHDLLIG